MKLALAGASGNFGKLAFELFVSNGHSVTGISRDNWDSMDLSGYDVCFLSVPVSEVGRYLQNCSECTAVEISSVKEPVRKYSGSVISIHPIFGPRSIDNPDFRNIIYVNDISQRNGEEIVRKLFPGFNLISMTAEEHDRAMVEVLIKPFFMSEIAAAVIKNNLSFTGPSQKILNQLASISHSESKGVLNDTIALNPYANQAIREIADISRKLEEDFRK